MDFNEYQAQARETALYPGSKEQLSKHVAVAILEDILKYYNENDLDDGLSESAKIDVFYLIRERLTLLDLIPLLYTCLGLAGETGELLEKIKKLIRDKNGEITHEFRDAVTKEIGDIQWYQANL